MIIIDHLDQTVRLYENQITVIYSRAILVAVTLANSADPDQTPHNAASDQVFDCFLKLQQV